MGTQLIEYTYSGDEQAWREAIETFLAHVRADPILAAGLTYAVFVREDGKARVHVPVWRDQAVLDRLQAGPFFKAFSSAIKGFAGGTLKTTKPHLSSG
jgi:quinol monooxygenase YgiN